MISTPPLRPGAVVGPAAVDRRAEAQLVAMRDGVRLATDVYLPAGDDTGLLTVLVRLPYDKSGRYTFMASIAAYLNAHGFAAVVQDVRGKFRSEGERVPFANELADGYDTLEWIVAQEWCGGAVGMLGDSYYGFTQWAAAASGHPALRAIVPRVTGSRFMEMFSSGAVPKIPLYEWAAHTFATSGLLDRNVLSERPLAGYDGIAPDAERMPAAIERQLVAACDDGSLLRGVFPGGPPAERLELPALHVGGWWDNLQRSQLDDWAAAGAAPAAAHQYLRMNATDHEDFELIEDGQRHDDHESDDDALLRYLPRMLDEPISFLRHYLSGQPGRWHAPRVRFRLANADWQVADRWPPQDTETVELQLGDGGRSLLDADGGTLRSSGSRGAEATTVEWTHDPSDPVPFLTENEWGQLAGLPDERELHARADVPTFTSAAQAGHCDIVGSVELALTIAAGAPSTHVIVRLLDVYPDGRARMILEGATLAQTGGGPHAIGVRLGDTAYRLRPGHRLRVAISSSCYPLYIVHPGTAEDPWRPSTARSSRQRLQIGGADGAVLRLPIRGTLAAAGTG